ncbi:MAG: hypothetical protein ABIJ61_04600 [bacterium]
MDLKSILVIVVVIAVAVALLLSVCNFSSAPSARQHALDFVRHMQSDTIPDLDAYAYVDSLAASLYTGNEFDSLTASERLDRCRQDFRGQGRYRQMFVKSQVVVNRQELLNDSTATVEVSYIDRQSRIQYYTQMLLRRVADNWRICRLRLEPQ